MKNKNTPLVWRVLATLFAISLAAFIPALTTGCAMTQGQHLSALVQGGGQAWGARYLASQQVNGVVDPIVLAQYEKNLVGIHNVMAGGIDPFTFQSIVSTIKSSSVLTPDQQGAVGFLGGVSKEFIKDNANPLTPDGARIEAIAQQLASGLADAINQVTGTTFVIPTS